MGRLFLPGLIVLFLLSLITDLHYPIAIVLSVLVLLQLMDKFGKGIALLEVMAIYCCVIYLLAPLLGYTFYTSQNRLAFMWRKTMAVKPDIYFDYVLPAIIAYLIGLFVPARVNKRPDEGNAILLNVQRIKNILSKNKKIGMILIVTGLSFFVIKKILPGPLAFVGSIFYLFTYVGALYVYFQGRFRGRVLLFALLLLFVLWDAINTGMFTLLFYLGVTIASFFVVGRKIKFHYKLLVLIGGACCLIVLQLVKGSFRSQTWKDNYTGSKVGVFQTEVAKKVENFSAVFSVNAFFPIYVRLNQGWNTALVMRRIPAKQPYDGGTSIARSIAASVVPRALWPDKPAAGGVYNMAYFAGLHIRGWSTNIGPVGEAYGNFGTTGGIVYMFLFGLFLGYAYVLVFKLARTTPMLLLWIPLLFFEVMYSMENDTLQAFNSLIKASFFMWLFYKLFPGVFGKIKEQHAKMKRQFSYN